MVTYDTPNGICCRISTSCSTMPLPLLADVLFQGISSVPFAIPALKVISWIGLVIVLKFYCGGASNSSERSMHSKVVMITVLNEFCVLLPRKPKYLDLAGWDFRHRGCSGRVPRLAWSTDNLAHALFSSGPIPCGLHRRPSHGD
jgi:hypothetical protein